MGFAVKWNLTPLTGKGSRAPATQCGFQCKALLCEAQNPDLQQVFGAEDGIWTHTTLRSLVPETSAYAVSPPLHRFFNVGSKSHWICSQLVDFADGLQRRAPPTQPCGHWYQNLRVCRFATSANIILFHYLIFLSRIYIKQKIILLFFKLLWYNMLSSNLRGRLGFDGLLKRKYKACGVRLP